MYNLALGLVALDKLSEGIDRIKKYRGTPPDDGEEGGQSENSVEAQTLR